MSEKTPTVAGKQLSSSLKERLKRCGRYHSSPNVGTPQSRRLSVESPSHQSTDKPLNSENMAKKVCLQNLAETRKSLNENLNNSSVSSTSHNSCLNTENTESMCDLKDNAYHSKIVSILSERPQNQSGSERSRNQSVGKTSTKQLIGQSERSGPKKQEISGETECGTAQNNQTSNGPDPCCNSDNINKKSTGNHCFGNDVSLNTASPVTTKTGLDTNTTPVSSRVMKRTDMMRGTRINFDEKKTDTVSDTDSSIQKTVKAKPSEHCASSIVTDSEANKTAETRKKTKTNKSGETEGTVGHQHSLLKEISENEEILRKLKMVKMYRTKNNLIELDELIGKWRSVAQQGFQDLHDALPEPKPSLTGLLQHLGIDHNLVKFDPSEETFNS